MIYDIKELDDDGHRMKVTWAKMDNFINTFAQDLFRVQQVFESDPNRYGSDWTFRKWMVLKAGVSLDAAIVILEARKRALAAEERERLERVKRQRSKARREDREQQAAEAEERRKAAAAAAEAAAAEKAAREEERLKKAREEQERREAAKAQRDAEKAAREEEKKKAREHRNRSQGGKKAAATRKKNAKPPPPPPKPDDGEKPRPSDNLLAQWVYMTVSIESKSRCERGYYYSMMRDRIKSGVFDKDQRNPNPGKPWVIDDFIEVYVPCSKNDFYRCIREAEASEKVEENVVNFPR